MTSNARKSPLPYPQFNSLKINFSRANLKTWNSFTQKWIDRFWSFLTIWPLSSDFLKWVHYFWTRRPRSNQWEKECKTPWDVFEIKKRFLLIQTFQTQYRPNSDRARTGEIGKNAGTCDRRKCRHRRLETWTWNNFQKTKIGGGVIIIYNDLMISLKDLAF